MTPVPRRGPAYRFVTARAIVRCYAPTDAAALKEAIDASLAHLRPWMEWARAEPLPLEHKVGLCRMYRALFDEDREYHYTVRDLAERRVLGGVGVTPRGPGVRELGYWLASASLGQGLATELVLGVTRVLFEVDRVGRVEIHCDPANAKSAAVAARAGFRHEATLRERAGGNLDGPARDEMIWSLLRDEFPASPAATTPVTAFDALAAQLL